MEATIGPLRATVTSEPTYDAVQQVKTMRTYETFEDACPVAKQVLAGSMDPTFTPADI
jgi:hypothetical protein